MVIIHLTVNPFYITLPYELPTNQITLFQFFNIEKWSLITNKIIYIILVVSLVVTAIGYRVRLAIFVSMVSYLLFMGNYLGTAKSPHMSYVWHSQNLIWYLLFTLFLLPSSSKIQLNRRGVQNLLKRESYYWEEVVVVLTICAAYFGSGYSKLSTSGLEWANGYTMQGYMLQRYIYSGNPLAGLIVSDLSLAKLLSWITLALETIIPFCLLVPYLRWVTLLAFFFLHFGIKLIMDIDFIYSHFLVYLTFFLAIAIEKYLLYKSRRQLK